MKITEHVLKRPIAASVLALSVAVIGAYSLTRLEVDYLPKITYPMIKIHVWWRGATPEEIDVNIADPIERVLSTIDNLDYLESSSIEGMYTLLVNFQYGVNVEEAYQDVTTAMGRVARQLPRDMDPPVIIKADPSQLPIMEITVSSPDRDLVWLRDWCENWLQDRLVTVKGTAGVEVAGGLKREIRVHLEPERLEALNLSPAAVARAIYQENREMFAGRVTVASREIIARTMGEFESLDELRNVVVARQGARMVLLKDVASVEDSHEDARIVTRFNGNNCVKVSVLKQSEANTVEVAEAMQAMLDRIRADAPPDIEFGVVENQGDYVRAAISSVTESAVVAAILVVIVIFLFLGQWRQVVVMIVALPLTLLANFLFMRSAGFSLNVFSLGGMVVALGVALDNSTVAIENLTRLHRAGVKDFAVQGMREVGSPILAATLSFLALVLPFLMVPGLLTLLFTELVLVVAGVVVISLFVAWTVTPLLTDRMLRGLPPGARPGLVARGLDAAYGALAFVYDKTLSLSLTLRWLVMAGAAGVMALAVLWSWKNIGSEFLPTVDDGRIMVKVMMPSGTAVGEVDKILREIEKRLDGFEEIQSRFSLAGGKVWGLYTYEISNEGEVDVQLVPKSKRRISTDAFVEKLRPVISKGLAAPGGRIPVMHMKTKGIRQIGQQQVEIKVMGSELESIFAFAQRAAEAMRAAEGLAGVNISLDMTKPEYRVFIDRVRASSMGVSVRQIAESLQSLVNGAVATQYRDGSEYYAIRVMVPESKMSSKDDLENVLIDVGGGRTARLKDLAVVRRAVGPVEIVRENQIKQVIVRADSDGVSVGEAVAKARDIVSALPPEPGVSFELGGQAQMMNEMKTTAVFVIGFAVFFAFVVLAVQFESLKYPFLIMAGLPLCLAGMIFALQVTAIPLGATVAIGALIVIFAMSNDGVLLISFAEELRTTGGRTPREAIREAGVIRFRPRVMTTVTTIAGFVPLALNLGEGGDMLMPMAVAAIGGLIAEILVALYLMPALYLITTWGKKAQSSPVIEQPRQTSGQAT